MFFRKCGQKAIFTVISKQSLFLGNVDVFGRTAKKRDLKKVQHPFLGNVDVFGNMDKNYIFKVILI